MPLHVRVLLGCGTTGHTPVFIPPHCRVRCCTQSQVHPAPGPEEVNWSALWSDYRSRDLRRNLTRPLSILVVLFPIGIFTGGLMQLDYLLCPQHKCGALLCACFRTHVGVLVWEARKHDAGLAVCAQYAAVLTDSAAAACAVTVLGFLADELKQTDPTAWEEQCNNDG